MAERLNRPAGFFYQRASKAEREKGSDTALSEETGNRTEKADRHIVDQLILERAPRLSSSPVWPIVRPPLYALLDYREAREMADAIEDMDGYEAMDYASDLLDLELALSGVDRVPEEGACLIVTNHPTGVADGVAMYDALKARRPDVCFFANADALRICEGLEEVVIPVVWPPEERTMESSKETLREAMKAISDDRAIVIFPSGAVARRQGGRLRDEPWEDTPIRLARKHEIDIVPAHLCGPSSRLFQLFDKVSEELRDVTLFHEMLDKKEACFEIAFGPCIPPDALGEEGEEGDTAEALRKFCDRVLAEDPDAEFSV